MDAILQAIETKAGNSTLGSYFDNKNATSASSYNNTTSSANHSTTFYSPPSPLIKTAPTPEPTLHFEERPPQWCIVDKWFTMSVICNERSIRELEAVVYNNDSEIVREIEPEITNDKEGKRAIVSLYPVPKSNNYRALFRMRFVNGSKGAWLHIGIHAVVDGQSRCLLKSPPIKVQTNRSKRPRDTKKRATPQVTSLSPSVVPATGNFPGRNDRMMLIFGANFYLWGKTPVVQLSFNNNNNNNSNTSNNNGTAITSSDNTTSAHNNTNDPMDISSTATTTNNTITNNTNNAITTTTNNTTLSTNNTITNNTNNPNNVIEIRPPNLIWWSDNLLEVQLPECCNQDMLVRVSNYDGVFGEGRRLKVVETPGTSADESRLLRLEKPLGNIIDYQLLTNSHLVLDYNPVNVKSDISEVSFKVILYVKNDKDFVLAETSHHHNESGNPDKISVHNLSVVVRVRNTLTDDVPREITIVNTNMNSSVARSMHNQRDQPFSYNIFRNSDNIMISLKLRVDQSLRAALALPRGMVLSVYLRKYSTSQYLLDPSTRTAINAEKPLFLFDHNSGHTSHSHSGSDHHSSNMSGTSGVVVNPNPSHPLAHPSHALCLAVEEVNNTSQQSQSHNTAINNSNTHNHHNHNSGFLHTNVNPMERRVFTPSPVGSPEWKLAQRTLVAGIAGCHSIADLEKWQQLLDSAFNDLQAKREELNLKHNSNNNNNNSNNNSSNNTPTPSTPTTPTNNSSYHHSSSHPSKIPRISKEDSVKTPTQVTSFLANGSHLTSSPPSSYVPSLSPAQSPMHYSSSGVTEDDEDESIVAMDTTNTNTTTHNSVIGMSGVPGTGEEQDVKDKTIAVPQNSPIASSFGNNERRPSVVFWKFFNPGTRTFLELSGGKLQIIGSRRIQILMEGMPPGSKFITANLYVQKLPTAPLSTPNNNGANNNGSAGADQQVPGMPGYEMIENCARCKENGIPNVFCVLPRRGREHDYPWITFRITCTSTAKHWKGSPFWIGAEFLLDSSATTNMNNSSTNTTTNNNNVVKVFSPPIHVQSKVKADNKSTASSLIVSSLTSPSAIITTTSAPSHNSVTISNHNNNNASSIANALSNATSSSLLAAASLTSLSSAIAAATSNVHNNNNANNSSSANDSAAVVFAVPTAPPTHHIIHHTVTNTTTTPRVNSPEILPSFSTSTNNNNANIASNLSSNNNNHPLQIVNTNNNNNNNNNNASSLSNNNSSTVQKYALPPISALKTSPNSSSVVFNSNPKLPSPSSLLNSSNSNNSSSSSTQMRE